jgi:hypothetical protein
LILKEGVKSNFGKLARTLYCDSFPSLLGSRHPADPNQGPVADSGVVRSDLSHPQTEGLIEMDGRIIIVPKLNKLEAELGDES